MMGVVLSEVNNLGGSILLEPLESAGSVQADKIEASSGVAQWGASNNLPREIIDLVAKSTELGALLDWKVKILHGKRIKAIIRDADGVGKEIEDEDIKKFLKSRTTKRYWREACIDITWFANVFVELIKANDKKNIAYIGTQDASFCRFGEMVKGKITDCYVSAKWPNAKKDDPETLPYKVIDPYSYTSVEDFQKPAEKKGIYPISMPSPGKLYYQLSSWDGLRLSKWLELMVNIPILKDAYIRQVLNVVYKISVREDLWKQWYKDWDDLTDAQKIAKQKEWLKAMNDKLTGVEKGGSSLIAGFSYDDGGSLREGIKIEAIVNPFKDGQWLEDSQEGSAHTRVALGVDATLVGAGPGKSMGAGSGSDKLVAVKIYDAQQIMIREVLLEPLYFIAETNGWIDNYPNLELEVEGIDLNFDKATVRPIGQKGGASATT
jgi:hypothetical protein